MSETNTVLERGSLFPPELVTDLFNKVKGKSAVANLCGQSPVPFNGNSIFTFAMDDEVDLVAESGAKSRGNLTMSSVKIVPLKIEYGARISDEFYYSSQENQIEIFKNFNDGFAKKAARGLDIMSMHGVNPRSKATSTLIGTNHFDNGVTTITTGATADEKIEDAIASVQDYDVSGIILAPSFRSDLAKLTAADGRKLYPELAWGAAPGTINGLPVQVNNTVSFNSSTDLGIVGDFTNAFRWGFAKEIPIEIIPYGDPDNSGQDLKGHNQIYIRAEAYIGWGILDKNAFAVLKPTPISSK